MRSVQFVSLKTVEVQGHRGASYIYPENTIESFIAAAESGNKPRYTRYPRLYALAHR
jgi:hypothetical protein